MNVPPNEMKCFSHTAAYLTYGRYYVVIYIRENGLDSTVCVVNDMDQAEWYYVDPTFTEKGNT